MHLFGVGDPGSSYGDTRAIQPTQAVGGEGGPRHRAGELPAEPAVRRERGREQYGHHVAQVDGAPQRGRHERARHTTTPPLRGYDDAGDAGHRQRPPAPELAVLDEACVCDEQLALEDSEGSAGGDRLLEDRGPPREPVARQPPEGPQPHVECRLTVGRDEVTHLELAHAADCNAGYFTGPGRGIRGYARLMPRLLIAVLATMLVFMLALFAFGAGIGTVELFVWTVLLIAALTAEVLYFRRRTASSELR